MIVTQGAIQEYQSELEQLLSEDFELDKAEKEVGKRRTEIKDRVKDIGMKLGGERERCIMPAGEVGAWDRRVSFKGAGLDLGKLEEILGQVTFRRIACNKVTLYEPSQDKINLARRQGKLTEATLTQATVEGSPQYALYKMDGNALSKAMEAGN